MDLRDIKEFFRDFLGYIIAFLVIIFVFTFVIAFHPVAGNSMVSTLEEGDITLVSKFYQHFFKLKRNQIVVVKKESKTYIKRIVGLPGEDIAYLNNTLYVDGEKYKESFLDDDVTTNNFLLEDICEVSDCDCSEGVIPEGYYLVLGDNRNDSKDSREFGLVKKSEIKGVAMFKIWPVNGIKKI